MTAPPDRGSVPLMTEDRQRRRSTAETLFGRPKPWLAWVWLAVGVLWLVVAITDPSVFRYVAAAVWLAGGIGMLTVSYRARRRAPR